MLSLRAVLPFLNRPFLSCLLPLCQNKSSCETTVMKVRFNSIYSCKSNSFSSETFHARARFKTEAQVNSEMTCYISSLRNFLSCRALGLKSPGNVTKPYRQSLVVRLGSIMNNARWQLQSLSEVKLTKFYLQSKINCQRS